MSPKFYPPNNVVLVAEDDELLRLNAEGILEDAGFRPICAKNASQALDLMNTTPGVRVLFTDVQMPGPFDGLDLARKVHEQWPKVLLLVTSGHWALDQNKIADHGHFLPKPYTAKAVVEEIESLAKEADAYYSEGKE